MLKPCRSQGLPDRKAGHSSACAPCASRQGPSPLPQRPADPWPAGGPEPPARARPAPGGRFSPAGSGAGLCYSRTCRSAGNRSARAGKRSAFPGPARTDKSTFTPAVAGAITPATAPRHPTQAGGPKPPASARPAPGGRWPAVVLGETAPRRCGLSPGGERRCVSGSAQAVIPAPEAGNFPSGGRPGCFPRNLLTELTFAISAGHDARNP